MVEDAGHGPQSEGNVPRDDAGALRGGGNSERVAPSSKGAELAVCFKTVQRGRRQFCGVR